MPSGRAPDGTTGYARRRATGDGNGVIDGNWNSATGTDESFLFWQHVRLANLAAGPTDVDRRRPTSPTNAVGGEHRHLERDRRATPLQITGMTGTYQICSAGILGKFVKQLDIQMDDGNTATGSMRATAEPVGAPGAAAIATSGPGGIDDATNYTVCMTF